MFVGTVRDNIILARSRLRRRVVRRCAVDAWDWVQRLPQQLGTVLGSGRSSDAGASGLVALARLVVADPHTLVLDDVVDRPRTARHLRLDGRAAQDRTVVAIAHRLHRTRCRPDRGGDRRPDCGLISHLSWWRPTASTRLAGLDLLSAVKFSTRPGVFDSPR